MALLPVERRGAPPPDGESPASQRVYLDSNLRRWFARNLGLWRSRRQYVFKNEEVLFLDMMIRVEIFAESRVGKPHYRMSWWPEHETDFFDRKPRYQREGVMEATLMGHQLLRSRAYLEEVESRTQIRQVDEHEVVFESHYLDWDVQEYTRLIDQDRFRSRAIYSWQKGDLEIVEHHHETRLEDASAPIDTQ
ncbi:hypothetical protein SynMITS9220_01043 [Synechococcus sp. MIT S9220]|uniref:hypothetical protein n=1 Tax=unclassified Synechococcus TaxID=2626047 RepID=UPI00164AF6BE|nr:hypothetical protein [Synechococcus sp. MIT S9220]NOL47333.1 hypothetical protein [Synechococcus sp. MIT S9220]QNJ22348.1 hypothetical protein SynMITS9220_01043 [Synechococcus sp. MIT S9220]